jgi:hypothetical protein
MVGSRFGLVELDDVRHVGFSVFVKHRQRRLTLKRFLPTVEAARAFVDELRRHRFHAQDAIFVVDEATGAIVTMPSNDGAPEAPPSSSTAVLGPVSSMTFEAHAGMMLAATEASLVETTATLRRLVRLRRELRQFAVRLRDSPEEASPLTLPSLNLPGKTSGD